MSMSLDAYCRVLKQYKHIQSEMTMLYCLNYRRATVYIFSSPPFTIKLFKHIALIGQFISVLMWTLTFECIIVFHIYVCIVLNLCVGNLHTVAVYGQCEISM